MKQKKYTLLSIALLLFIFIYSYLMGMSVAESRIVSITTLQCTYNPNSGQPNPLGQRAFITVTQDNSDTYFTFRQFPGLIQLPETTEQDSKARAVTLEIERTLVFYDTSIEHARELMRVHNDYYYELIGYEDKAGFSSYDEAMACV